jgi:2-polyprenyl-6-methoxyphenol hydroxylase-like FAD-dependent oxidoreductase
VRVAVVGCGTAGAASAILLARAGHDVTVHERFADPSPVGAGLLLQPTGLAVLDRLGLGDRIRAGGDEIRRLVGVTAGGRRVMDLAYADLAPGLTGLGVHRGALFGALFDALRESGTRLELGHTLTSLDELDAELVVVAGGARSELRPPGRVREYPWGALWCIVPDPERVYGGELAQTYRGTAEMVGFLPTGGAVSLFWSVRAGEPPPADLGAWADRVCALQPRARPILDLLTSTAELLPATYRDVRLPAWHAGRSVFLGDAGHAMSPQLGQGANLALMDAAVLADCLAAERDDVPAALARYSATRRRHLRFYARASRALTPVFQSRGNVLSRPRDLLMGPAGRVPWVRRQMLATLAGIKEGPFRTAALPGGRDPGTRDVGGGTGL